MSLKPNILIMPNGEIAFQLIEPQPKLQEKIIEFEKRETVNLAFLKVIEKLPKGCRSFNCVQKLLKSFPILPWTCSNCQNSPKLILRAGFCYPSLKICENCTTECAKLTALQRMRKILFQKCELLKR